MADQDTIVAIASPHGFGGRGIIRMSGPACRARVAGMSDLDRNASPGFIPITLHFDAGHLPALALIAAAPHSYTAEDTLELHLAGNPMLLDRLVDRLVACDDVRRAEAGEFTARAFLHGRISLTEAEGVAAAISALSDADLRAANQLRSGALGRLAHELADALAGALALVEAGIDFTDEDDVVAIGPDDLHARVSSVHERLDEVLSRAVGREQLDALPRIVLAGPANAGKSTLFNALLGRTRAIVSDVAGTTRDVLAEPMTIATDHGPAEIMLIDLAGTEDPVTVLDEHMQAAARDAIDGADLVLHCVRADVDIDQYELRHVDMNAANVLRLRTQIDRSTARPTPDDASDAALSVSAMTGVGMEALRAMIVDRLADRAVSLAADAFAILPRHEAHLRDAVDHLRETIERVSLQCGSTSLDDAELIALSLRSALDAMASLAGDITPDDVLGRVFATFCVGK